MISMGYVSRPAATALLATGWQPRGVGRGARAIDCSSALGSATMRAS
jgi:hypothetical protein